MIKPWGESILRIRGHLGSASCRIWAFSEQGAAWARPHQGPYSECPSPEALGHFCEELNTP